MKTSDYKPTAKERKIWEELGLYAKRDRTVGMRHMPEFKDEAEEVAWLDRTHDAVTAFVIVHGLGRRGHSPAVERMFARSAAARKREPARLISIRLSEEDIALAQKQAGEAGLPYQTYLKTIITTGLRKPRVA